MPPSNWKGHRTCAACSTIEDMTMRKRLFRILAAVNRKVLPKQWHRDLTRLGKARKALVAYRYWVTRNAL